MSVLSNLLASLTGEARRAAVRKHAAELKAIARRPRKPLTAAMLAEMDRTMAELNRPLDFPVVMPSGRVVMPGERLSDEEREQAMTPPTTVVEPASAPIVNKPAHESVKPEPGEPMAAVKRIIKRAQPKSVPEGLEGYANGGPLLYVGGRSAAQLIPDDEFPPLLQESLATRNWRASIQSQRRRR